MSFHVTLVRLFIKGNLTWSKQVVCVLTDEFFILLFKTLNKSQVIL